MNRSSDGNTKSNLTICSIIQKLSDCILLVNISGIIEVVNPSVTILLGYTPEQLFGYMPVCEEHTIYIADNELKNPCVITILEKHGNSSTEITSFVVILRDESVLVQQQSDAEKAKKRSKSLSYKILPRSIVVKLNQGEMGISFTVPSTTIMFIDIAKFSEYAANLNLQEIMSNLSMKQSNKYSLLYKIKLISEVSSI